MKSPRFSRPVQKLSYGAALLALLASARGQTNGKWFGTGGNSWATTTSWEGGAIAGGTGAIADFTFLNLLNTNAISLDGARTLGTLKVNDVDATDSWIFKSGATLGNVLTLDNGGLQPIFDIGDGLQSPRSASITATVASTNGFVKTGLGTLTLDAPNPSLTGQIWVQKGTLRLNRSDSVGPAPNGLDPSCNIRLGIDGAPNPTTNWTRLDLATGVNLANPLFVGYYRGPNSGAITITDPGLVTPVIVPPVATVSGPITVKGIGGLGGLFSGPFVKNGNLIVTGTVTADPSDLSSATQAVNSGYVQLGGGGTIATWQNSGYLRLGGLNGLGTHGSLFLINAANGPATWDLNGFDQTLSKLGSTQRSNVTNSNAGATISRLTLNNASNETLTYTGSLSGKLGVTKTGGNQFTIAGTDSTLSGVAANAGSPVATIPSTFGLAAGQQIRGVKIAGTTSLGSNSMTLDSTVGLVSGMSVYGPSVAPGTTIYQIDGNTVLLSSSAIAEDFGVVHEFSPFPVGATIVSIEGPTQFTASNSALATTTSFTLVFPSAHTYSGPTVLNAGTYRTGTMANGGFASGIGAALKDPTNLIFEGGTLLFSGFVATQTDRRFTINNTANAKISVSEPTGSLEFTSDGVASTGGFDKLGFGRLTLSGNHFHTGPTTVKVGTLAVTGSLSAISPVVVEPSATFAGAGSVGPITIEPDGTLEVGPNSTATLNAPSVNMKDGSHLGFNFTNASFYDKLVVTNPGGLNFGAISLTALQTGSTTTTFSVAGSYDIIDYNTSFTGNLSSVVITGGAVGKTYRLVDKPASTIIAMEIAAITSTGWVRPDSGNWQSSSSWAGGAIPNGFGVAASFGPTLTSSAIVTLDTPVSVSGLTFNSFRGYTISGLGSINLDGGGAEVDIKVDSGVHVIDVPITLASSLRVTTIDNTSIEFAKNITTTRGATFLGAGTSILSGDTQLSDVSVQTGTLQIGNGGTTGSILGSAITSTNNGKVAINRSDTFSFPTNIQGSLATLIHSGIGTTTLTGTESDYFILSLDLGTLNFGSLDAVPGYFYDPVLNTVSGAMSATLAMTKGTFDLNGLNIDLTESWTSTLDSILIDDSNTPGVSVFTYASPVAADFKGSIRDGATRAVGLGKKASSTLTLSGASNFSGGVNLNNGQITVKNNTALGTGPVTVGITGTGSSSNFARLALNQGIKVSNPITLENQYANGTTSSTISLTTGTVTAELAGPITVNKPTTNGYTIFGGSISTANSLLTISGALNSPIHTLVTGGNIRLSGGGDYDAIQHRTGAISLGATNAMSTDALLYLGQSGAARLNLNGFNQTLSQVVRASNSFTATVENTSASPATLTLNSPSPFIYTGTFSGNLGVTKQFNSGDLTLTGSNIHTGPTTSQGGILALSGTGRLTVSQVILESGAVFMASGVTGVVTLTLGGGIAGDGFVQAGSINLAVGGKFEPKALSITTPALTFGSSTVTTYDVRGNLDYDALTVNGSMTNNGSLNILIGTGFSIPNNWTFNLATASGGITRGYTTVKIDGTALNGDGSGTWMGTVGARSYSYTESTGTLTVTTGDAPNQLQAWLNDLPAGFRGLMDDPDGDGLSNLLEYATRSDPLSGNSGAATLGISGDHLTLTYRRRFDSGLTYTVEAADELDNSWTTAIGLPNNNPMSGAANDTVTVVDAEFLSAHPRRFLRLSVTYTP